jgi:phosphoserine phosphatase
MTYRLTLVSAPNVPLRLPVLQQIARTLDDFGVHVVDGPHWAAPHRAAFLTLNTSPRPDHMATLRLMCGPDQVDVLVIQESGCANDTCGIRLFLADMDSTMLVGETLDDLAELVGVREQVAALTAKAMNGEMDYRAALAARLELIKGVGPEKLTKVLKNQRASPGGRTLVATLNAYGVRTVLVSGGFTYFTEPVAQSLDFKHNYGNILDVDHNGCITGKVLDPLIHHSEKLKILETYVRDMNIRTDQVMAVGDGANDVPMINAAGYGFAYRPKPAVRDKVVNHILYGDLTSILYAVGIPFDRFVHTPDPVFS